MKQPLAIDKLHNVYVNEVNRIENKSLFITHFTPYRKICKNFCRKRKTLTNDHNPPESLDRLNTNLYFICFSPFLNFVFYYLKCGWVEEDTSKPPP